MSNHDLRRSPNDEPVCLCGYRPEILDEPAPVGKHWKAKTVVLDHAKALNDAESANEWKAALDALARPLPEPTPLRSPDAPFAVPEARYPRAGVRQTSDGRWKLSCWDGDQIVHVIDEPVFDDRVTAFDYGFLTIGACRESGTNLNGWAA
ncbi:hypothetical protein NG701_17045 [Pseudarthrobacter sp. HLT3-5]|uniref:hypothetical protein n=1 Tax=Pseudarthrobacter cellobiosi TaxID=2953654 RepID=UPI00208ED4DE|nr:hypothetical protein [Pseudarthrobacter sp. HLT3-5]MCO4276110.1 hypothetical protein [Pseudarthrobacter sp. HLT3-5]